MWITPLDNVAAGGYIMSMNTTKNQTSKTPAKCATTFGWGPLVQNIPTFTCTRPAGHKGAHSATTTR